MKPMHAWPVNLVADQHWFHALANKNWSIIIMLFFLKKRLIILAFVFLSVLVLLWNIIPLAKQGITFTLSCHCCCCFEKWFLRETRDHILWFHFYVIRFQNSKFRIFKWLRPLTWSILMFILHVTNLQMHFFFNLATKIHSMLVSFIFFTIDHKEWHYFN